MNEVLGLYQQPQMLVERVHCCVCAGSGSVTRWVFWKKACSVCDGQGKRRILIAANLSPADRAMVLNSAVTGQFPIHAAFSDWLGLKL